MSNMHKQFSRRSVFQLAMLVIFIVSTVTASATLLMKPAHAANFSMQTGYYIGSGVAGKVISGLGFQPNMVMIKASNATTPAVFKTSAMATANTAFMSSTIDNTASVISFNSDGFVLNTNFANTNASNILFTWTAFAGSDCTSTGTFCVGTYTGNATNPRTITTGFQPGIILLKQSTAAAMHFKTASMAAGQTDFITSTANDTAGAYINTITSTGFTVGATDNLSAGIYYYVAFKTGTGVAAEGSYVGDGNDNRDISGVGFRPYTVMVKNDTSATAINRRSILSTNEHNGDGSSFLADTLSDLSNYIQAVQADGFQVGTAGGANEAAATMYWIAFGGVPALTGASGTYTMATGTYTGTGAIQSITGMTFAPDLVMIKDNAANYSIFRTRMMPGDLTGYLGVSSGDFGGGITSLNADGFSLGVSTLANTSGNTYHWQAFGNAYRPETKSGAADFAMGVYNSTGANSQKIGQVPFQMDFVAVRRTAMVFRTSSQVGDVSSTLSATADTTGAIQSLNSDGFNVGTNANVSTLGSIYRWFGFKAGTNFAVGSYTGDGVVDRPVTIGSGFQPDLTWIKRSTNNLGVSRPNTVTGNVSHFFSNAAATTDRIKTVTSTGITLGNTAEVNTSTGLYRYIAWKIPATAGTVSGDIVTSAGVTVPSPVFTMNPVNYPFECSIATGSLGTSSQRIRISNTTSTATWTSSIAATAGATALWRNGGNTQQYDYNEPSGSPVGCSDGSDTDSKAGKLRIEPSSATITPQSGCSTSNITLGSNADFNETTTNAITLASTSSGAATNCYWDFTGINLRQYIPAQQASDSYTLNLTITTVSS